jgi:hypothetical protein
MPAMSFDMTVRSDNHYAQSLPRQHVSELISSISGIRQDAATHFVLLDQHRTDSLIDLDIDFASREGDSIADACPDQVNCIRLYAHDEEGIARLPQLCVLLAKRLGWRAYDEQAGSYLDMSDEVRE